MRMTEKELITNCLQKVKAGYYLIIFYYVIAVWCQNLYPFAWSILTQNFLLFFMDNSPCGWKRGYEGTMRTGWGGGHQT